MLYNWRTKRKKERFYRLTRAIFDTPPMPVVDAPWSIVSMVTDDYIQMYLLALKSFYSRVRRGKIIAIVARDMPDKVRAILVHHFPGIRFKNVEDIDTGLCQRGGTWERLVYLLDHAREEYAIQLDCDTLAFGSDLNEVVRCAENNIAFTLGNAGRPIKPMSEWAEEARNTQGDHICIVSERVLDRYPNAPNLKYVRASSGFCGFAKGGFPREKIEVFHQNMAQIVGEGWRKWGTEQCGSNFAIANSPGAIVLPYPKYANFWSGMKTPNDFVHFIGSNRYDEDYFAIRGQEVIKALQHGTSRVQAPLGVL